MKTDVCEPQAIGIVTKKNLGSYTVHIDGQTLACSLSPRLRDRLEPGCLDLWEPASSRAHGGRAAANRRPGQRAETRRRADPLAIGDRVRVAAVQPGQGVIMEVLPRRSKLARRSAVPMPSARPFEQVIVANADQVVPVFAAASPAPNWNLLDRYLVSAEAAGISAVVCLTKLDLVRGPQGRLDGDLQSVVDGYRRIGYPVVLVSAVTGDGLDELQRSLQGRTSVFLGKSGVGKTSLLNALQPGLGLRVREVSQVSGKGKHTTTALELFPLSSSEPWTAIVDTPGVQEFGLWDVDKDDLALFFPEMRPFVGGCRFGLDCAHNEEPGCAIRRAVIAGEISPHRYASYLRLKVDA